MWTSKLGAVFLAVTVCACDPITEVLRNASDQPLTVDAPGREARAFTVAPHGELRVMGYPFGFAGLPIAGQITVRTAEASPRVIYHGPLCSRPLIVDASLGVTCPAS